VKAQSLQRWHIEYPRILRRQRVTFEEDLHARFPLPQETGSFTNEDGTVFL
jgi:hypothetical protein